MTGEGSAPRRWGFVKLRAPALLRRVTRGRRTWLTDADVHPDKIAFSFPRDTKAADPAKSSLPPDAEAGPAKSYAIHAGFYRNVRATRFAVIAALERALDRRSVLDDDPESPRPPMEKPMTTLYLTGHSLGGAMAATRPSGWAASSAALSTPAKRWRC